MSKFLIIYEKNYFNFLIYYKRFKKIFIENNYNNISIKNEKHIKVNEFFNGIKGKEADYNVSINIDKIYKKIVNLDLRDINDDDLKTAHNTFKQKIALYACDINRSFTFARFIKKKYKIKNKISIETNIFNHKVYKIMKELDLLDKNIDILFEIKIISQIFYYFKNIYFFLKILTLPELNIFKNSIFKKKIFKKKKILSIFINDIKFDENNLNLSFLNKKKLKDKIVYLTEDKNISNSKNYNKYKKNIIFFNKELFKNFNFLYYLKNLYLELFLKRNIFLSIGINNPVFLNVLFKSLDNLTKWKLFYSIYETKFHLNAMSDEKVFVKDFHNKNNVKTIFLYFSTTEELFKKDFKNRFSRANYVYLNYDFFVSDNLSINLFKLQKTKVKKYIKIGNLGSDIILKNKNKTFVQKNRRKLEIKNTKKILSFFDHTFGRDGIWGQRDFYIFFKKIHELLSNKFNFEVIYKSKKTKLELYKSFTNQNKKLFNKILEYENFKYIAGDNNKISTYQIIGMSDVVVSAPISSVIIETLNASQKILVFDPTKKYKSKHFFINQFPQLYCNNENNFIYKFKKLHKMNNKAFSKKILKTIIFKKLNLKKYGLNLEDLLKIF